MPEFRLNDPIPAIEVELLDTINEGDMVVATLQDGEQVHGEFVGAHMSFGAPYIAVHVRGTSEHTRSFPVDYCQSVEEVVA